MNRSEYQQLLKDRMRTMQSEIAWPGRPHPQAVGAEASTQVVAAMMGNGQVRWRHSAFRGAVVVQKLVGPPRWRLPRIKFHHRGRVVGVTVGWRLTGYQLVVRLP